MSFSYDAAKLATSPIYQVRFRLGDTNSSTASFQDEEIAYALTCNGNDVIKTCIECINALLPRLAQQPDFKVGPYSETEKTRSYDYWVKVLAELKSKVASYSPPISQEPTGSTIFHYDMMGVNEYGSENPPRCI